MPKADFDSGYEPITVVVGGKEYTVKTISPNFMQEFEKIGTEEGSIESQHRILARKFCHLVGEELEVAMNMDIRKLSKAVIFICKAHMESEKKEDAEDTEKK